MIDLFDNYLVHTCDVQEKGHGSADALGVEDQTLTSIVTAVKCRLSTMGQGRRIIVDENAVICNQKVFMRPRMLGEHTWLSITASGDTGLYQVLDVLRLRDGAGVEHHLEVFVKQVKP